MSRRFGFFSEIITKLEIVKKTNSPSKIVESDYMIIMEVSTISGCRLILAEAGI